MPSATLSASASTIVTFMRRSMADRRRARPPREAAVSRTPPGVGPARGSRSRFDRVDADRVTDAAHHPVFSAASQQSTTPQRRHSQPTARARDVTTARRASCAGRAGRRARQDDEAGVLEAQRGPADLRRPRPAPRSACRLAHSRAAGAGGSVASGTARASAAGGTRRPGNSSATAQHGLPRRRRAAPSRRWKLDRRLSSRRSAPRGPPRRRHV
jgi:hypothetical protein